MRTPILQVKHPRQRLFSTNGHILHSLASMAPPANTTNPQSTRGLPPHQTQYPQSPRRATERHPQHRARVRRANPSRPTHPIGAIVFPDSMSAAARFLSRVTTPCAPACRDWKLTFAAFAPGWAVGLWVPLIPCIAALPAQEHPHLHALH